MISPSKISTDFYRIRKLHDVEIGALIEYQFIPLSSHGYSICIEGFEQFVGFVDFMTHFLFKMNAVIMTNPRVYFTPKTQIIFSAPQAFNLIKKVSDNELSKKGGPLC